MNRKLVYVLMLLMIGANLRAATPSEEEGKEIFKNRCSGCHNVNKQVLGPALSKVYDRRSMDWIKKFVQSSQTVIKSGDKEAVEVFQKFNQTPMPDHRDITDVQVESIVAYIKSQEAPEGGVDKVTNRPETRVPAYMPLALTDYGYITGFVGVVLLLILVLLLAVSVKNVEREIKKK